MNQKRKKITPLTPLNLLFKNPCKKILSAYKTNSTLKLKLLSATRHIPSDKNPPMTTTKIIGILNLRTEFLKLTPPVLHQL